MKINSERKFRLDKKRDYIGSCLDDKGDPVDLYFDPKDYYVARYGDERNNYSAMNTIVINRPDMIGHLLRLACRYHEARING